MNAQVQLSGKNRARRKTDEYVSQDICNMLNQKKNARKKKELDIHYMENVSNPTWFARKDEAVAFMHIMQSETNTRHVLEWKNDGYSVEPFFLKDAGGETIEENDTLYTANNKIYYVGKFKRKSYYEWIATAENENEPPVSISKNNASVFRHNPWTKSELKALRRQKQAGIRKKKIFGFLEAVLFGLVGIGLILLLSIAGMELISAINDASMQSNETVTVYEDPSVKYFNCKITGKSHETKTQRTKDNGYAVIDYYYITVTDAKSHQDVRFNCTEEFWENLNIGDPIHITMTIKTDDYYNVEKIFTVGDQELTGYYVVKERFYD